MRRFTLIAVSAREGEGARLAGLAGPLVATLAGAILICVAFDARRTARAVRSDRAREVARRVRVVAIYTFAAIKRSIIREVACLTGRIRPLIAAPTGAPCEVVSSDI